MATRNPRSPYAVKPAGAYGNAARSVLEGLSFSTAGEMEALARALAAGDMPFASYTPGEGLGVSFPGYRQRKEAIDTDYLAQAPEVRIIGEMAGALLPGIAGAVIPGGQGATLGALNRASRLLAEPVSAMASRFTPGALARMTQAAPKSMQFGMPVADEMLTGALTSVGSAPTMEDAGAAVDETLMQNFLTALGGRAATDYLLPPVIAKAKGPASRTAALARKLLAEKRRTPKGTR